MNEVFKRLIYWYGKKRKKFIIAGSHEYKETESINFILSHSRLCIVSSFMGNPGSCFHLHTCLSRAICLVLIYTLFYLSIYISCFDLTFIYHLHIYLSIYIYLSCFYLHTYLSIFILLAMIYISINPILVRAEGHEEEAGGWREKEGGGRHP